MSVCSSTKFISIILPIEKVDVARLLAAAADQSPSSLQLHCYSSIMGSNSTNGAGSGATLGDEFTREVIASMGPNTNPRLREVMSSFIKHIHDFAREVQLTTDEWMAGVQMINWAGQMSDDKRNEGQLLCDIIGFES
jgi:hypothetical protein